MASVEMSDAEKIAELREKFKNKYVDPPSPNLEKFDPRDLMRIWNDDLFALSFIHWKKEVIDHAVEMVAQVLEWRKANDITDLSVEDIGEEYFERGVIYLHGRAIDRSRVLVLVGRLQTNKEKEKIRKVFTFYLERLQRNKPGRHVTFVLDTSKTGMSNVDLGMIKYIIESFTTNFPDLLERIIILDMPWIMNAIWNIVKQWMSEEQRSKVSFCSRKDLKKFIAADQLPKSMSGTSDWTYSFPPFPDDLSQDHDFKDDPMNFKIEEKAEAVNGTAFLPIEDVTKANGDIKHRSTEFLNNNNNHQLEESLSDGKLAKVLPEKKVKKPVVGMNGDMEEPSTFETTPVTPLVNGLDRTSTPLPDSSKLRKAASLDQNILNGLADSPTKEELTQLRHHDTVDDSQRSDKLPPNVSFQSLAPNEETGNQIIPTPGEKMKVETAMDEICLGNLLVMSPVSELTFTLEGERLEGYMSIRNPNLVTVENDNKIFVAYKVKTTSPERYHVKPSLGVIAPGDSVRIRIYLSTGHEASMPKDRFLILYKPMVVDENTSFAHGEIAKFWKKNSDKSSHFEHRVRVKVDDSVVSSKVVERKESKDDLKAMTPTVSTPLPSFLAQEEIPPKGVEYSQLQQQIGLLNNKITRIESDSRWMRRRMRHTMGLLFVVIILMFLILYEVTMVSYRMSFTNQSACNES